MGRTRNITATRGKHSWTSEKRRFLHLVFTELILSDYEITTIIHSCFQDMMAIGYDPDYDKLRDLWNARNYESHPADWCTVARPRPAVGNRPANTTPYTATELAEYERVRGVVHAVAAARGIAIKHKPTPGCNELGGPDLPANYPLPVVPGAGTAPLPPPVLNKPRNMRAAPKTKTASLHEDTRTGNGRYTQRRIYTEEESEDEAGGTSQSTTPHEDSPLSVRHSARTFVNRSSSRRGSVNVPRPVLPPQTIRRAKERRPAGGTKRTCGTKRSSAERGNESSEMEYEQRKRRQQTPPSKRKADALKPEAWLRGGKKKKFAKEESDGGSSTEESQYHEDTASDSDSDDNEVYYGTAISEDGYDLANIEGPRFRNAKVILQRRPATPQTTLDMVHRSQLFEVQLRDGSPILAAKSSFRFNADSSLRNVSTGKNTAAYHNGGPVLRLYYPEQSNSPAHFADTMVCGLERCGERACHEPNEAPHSSMGSELYGYPFVHRQDCVKTKDELLEYFPDHTTTHELPAVPPKRPVLRDVVFHNGFERMTIASMVCRKEECEECIAYKVRHLEVDEESDYEEWYDGCGESVVDDEKLNSERERDEEVESEDSDEIVVVHVRR